MKKECNNPHQSKVGTNGFRSISADGWTRQGARDGETALILNGARENGSLQPWSRMSVNGKSVKDEMGWRDLASLS